MLYLCTRNNETHKVMKPLTHIYLDERVNNSKIHEVTIEELNKFLEENNAQICYQKGYGEPYKFFDRFEDVELNKFDAFCTPTITVVPKGTSVWRFWGCENVQFVFPWQEQPCDYAGFKRLA